MIELLVVAAILSLLATLGVSALGATRKSAMASRCQSNLHQWGVIWQLYTDDHAGSFSQGTTVEWARGEWVTALQNHFGRHPDLLLCPSAIHRRAIGAGERLLPNDDRNATDHGGPNSCHVFPVPDDNSTNTPTGFRWLRGSYGINNWVYNPAPDVIEIQGRPTRWNWRFMNVPHPSRVPLFADAMWRGGGPDHTDLPPVFNGAWAGYDAEFHHFAIARHRNGIQVLFFDGSVVHQYPRQLWSLPWHREFNEEFHKIITFPRWML